MTRKAHGSARCIPALASLILAKLHPEKPYFVYEPNGSSMTASLRVQDLPNSYVFLVQYNNAYGLTQTLDSTSIGHMLGFKAEDA